jgi:hypothetical protein
MSNLKIERIGGLAGFGMSRSRLRSSGEKPISALSADDQAAVETLFRQPNAKPGVAQHPDAFRYRITRSVDGKDQTVEVPETSVPQALKDCVKDELM